MSDAIPKIRLAREPWRGWDSLSILTREIKVRIVPELGGRVMEYRLGEHEFFWVNPHRAASSPATSSDVWSNWGGDKVWLAPQGWDSEDQWAGPPDAVLDSGRFDAEVDAGRDAVHIRLTSPQDSRSGMQVTRSLCIRPGTTQVDIVCTMTNISERARRWGLWPVAQIDAASRRVEGMNTQLRACVPLNSKSAYGKGFRVIYGEDDNPQYSVAAGTLEVNYQHRVGKIGADSEAGWMAVIDGDTGAVLVMQMTVDPHAEYPDGASVEIWTNGLGMLTAYGRTEAMPDTLEKNPYMLECELLSPFARLGPGETYSFAYTWSAANIGEDEATIRRSISSCNACSCEVEAFTIAASGEVAGRFGVFHAGDCVLEFVDSNEITLNTVGIGCVSPLAPVVLHGVIPVPPNAVTAVLALYTDNTQRIGELARTVLTDSIRTH